MDMRKKKTPEFFQKMDRCGPMDVRKKDTRNFKRWTDGPMDAMDMRKKETFFFSKDRWTDGRDGRDGHEKKETRIFSKY
jgi:hypothetical protein